MFPQDLTHLTFPRVTTRFCERGEDIFISYSDSSCPHSTLINCRHLNTTTTKRTWQIFVSRPRVMNHVSKEQIDSKSIFTILSLKAEANIPYNLCRKVNFGHFLRLWFERWNIVWVIRSKAGLQLYADYMTDIIDHKRLIMICDAHIWQGPRIQIPSYLSL